MNGRLGELPEGSRLLYKVLSGSHATNLVTPTSDEDWRGVYQVPTRTLLGLQQPPETVEVPPDETYWELGHFARLCIKGNPNIMELLWIGAQNPQYRDGY
jgi:predicted nucleotidyltransferase